MSKKIILYLLLTTCYLLLSTGEVRALPKDCSGLYCHGGQTVNWTATQLGSDCGPCHSSQGAGTAPEEFTWKHKIHSSTTPIVNGVGSGYGYACDQCHTRYGTDVIGHVNGPAYAVSNGSAAAEVKFYRIADNLTERTTSYGKDTTIMRFLSLSSNPYTSVSANPVYTKGGSTVAVDRGYFGISSGSCSGIWCHSNANPLGGTNLYVTVFTTDTVTCVSCHKGAGTAGGTNLSLAHSTHTRTTTYNYNCSYCHYDTAQSSYTIRYSSHHVNGFKSIEISTANRNTYALDYNTTTRRCVDTYCHSNAVTVWTGGVPSSTVTWTSTGTVNCGSCHGGGSANGIPNYANGSPKPNSHEKHNSYNCQKCHNATTSNGTTITGFNQHVSSTYTVTAGAGASFSYNFASTPSSSTCNDISCHGGNNATWGQTLTCYDCHVSTYDQVDYVYNDGNGTMALISTYPGRGWYDTGHGRPTSSYYDSSNRGAGLTSCLYCHSSGTVHTDNRNGFYRLYVSSDNTVCLNCHKQGVGAYSPSGSGLPAINASTEVAGAHVGSRHNTESGYTDGGMFCWDCHDAHGDYNVTTSSPVGHMVQLNPAYLTEGTTIGAWTAYGVPRSTTVANGVRFAAPYDTWGSYVSTNPIAGICQVCHDSVVSHFNMTTYDNTHKQGTNCKSCHKHDENFKPAGCNACHGGGTSPTSPNYSVFASTNYWPDGNVRSGNDTADRGGSHEKHVIAISSRQGWTASDLLADANQQKVCKYCHGDTMPPSGHPGDEPADLPGSTLGITEMRKLDNTGGTLGSVDTASSHTWLGSGAGGYCNNSDCHWNTQTPNWYGVNQGSAPAPANCTTCHTDFGVSGSTWPNIAAHRKHAGTQAGQEYYAYACTKCHASSAYQVKPVDSTDLHNNNTWELSFAGIGANFKYKGTEGYSLGTSSTIGYYLNGTCSNIYCHGNQPTVAWNTGSPPSGEAKCDDCHRKPPDGNIPYTHLVHNSTGAVGISIISTPTAYNYGCSICHSNVNTSGTNLNVANHAQGQVVGGTQTAQVEFYQAIASTTGFTASYSAKAVRAGTDDRGFDYTQGTCSNTYCHGVSLPSGTRMYSEPGVPQAVSVSTPNWNVNLASATAGGERNIACGSCHNLFSSDSGSHRIHISTDTISESYAGSGYRFDCGKCHNLVDNNSNNYSADLSSRTYHINKSKNIDFDSWGGNWVP
jgi:predicted CxxxxCH...CXXCH cytochrome family protein